jgi:adenosylcobinamide kinase / adenosylcobinamide-phosphate guanylyltransferase
VWIIHAGCRRLLGRYSSKISLAPTETRRGKGKKSETRCATVSNDHPGTRQGVTLVLGGARSGKSRYAEELLIALPLPRTYVATAQGLDDEMAARIAAHQARRGPEWQTIEAPHDLVGVLSVAAPGSSMLIDCVTLWLSNRMLAHADVEAEIEALQNALARSIAPVVLVSNEVGSGIVPDNALARRFRDLQGRLNQRLAARAERVVLLVAGLPLMLKGNS